MVMNDISFRFLDGFMLIRRRTILSFFCSKKATLNLFFSSLPFLFPRDYGTFFVMFHVGVFLFFSQLLFAFGICR